MAILDFGAGVIAGAAAVATYWAPQYWESQRRLDEAVAKANSMKELLHETQNLLMERNRQLDEIKEVLAEGDSNEHR